MPTDVYEISSSEIDAEPSRFEIVQRRMPDPALTVDPVGGEPVQRVTTGGVGVISCGGLNRSTVVNKCSSAATACRCATGKPHRH